MGDNYWNLFWQTGLPEAWLLGRIEDRPKSVAAFGEECVSDGPIPLPREKWGKERA